MYFCVLLKNQQTLTKQDNIAKQENQLFGKVLNGTFALQYFNLLRFGTTILIMIVLAKSGLPQGDIDAYEIFWFLASMLSFFWVSASINAALTQFPKLEEGEQGKAFFNIFIFFLGVSAFISAGLYFGAESLAELFSFQAELPYLPLLSIFLLFQTPAWLVQIYYLLLKKYRRIIVFGTAAFSLQLLAVILPLTLGQGLEEIFYGLIFTAVFKFVWLLLLLYRHAEPVLDKRLLQVFLLLALPLVLKAFLNHGYEYIDGFIVNDFFKEENKFAIFRYGAREMPYVTLFIGAVVTAMLPEAARDLTGGMSELKEKIRNLARWMFPASAVLMLLSPLLFEWGFNPEFRESAFVFNVYLLMLSSRILLPQVVVMAKEESWFLVVSALIEIIVNITLSFVLVRIIGLSGIAFASVIAFYVNKVNQIIFLRLRYGISPSAYVPIKAHLAWSVLLYGSFGLSLLLYQY